MAVAASGRPGGVVGAVARLASYALSVARQNSANILTLARLIAIVPILVSLGRGDGAIAFWLFFAAALSDAADGFVAKRVSGPTTIGRVLDPIADKLLLASLLIALGWIGAVPLWLVALAVARDLAIALGAVIMCLTVPGFRIVPLFTGKLCTFGQLILVGVALAGTALMPAAGALVPALAVAVAALTVLSAAAYLSLAMRYARASVVGA